MKRMIGTSWTAKVVNWMEANKIEAYVWDYIKERFPRKYKKIQRDIKAWGIEKIKIGFAQGVRPVGCSITL